MTETTSRSAVDLQAAMALRDAGRAAEAEARLRRGGPLDAEGLALLAHLQLQQGQLDAAQETHSQLAALAPGSAPAERSRARLLQRSGRSAEAVDAARAAQALAPQDDETLLVLANALLAAGDAAAAHVLIGPLAARQPQNGPAQFVLAQAAGRLNRTEEALAACQAALRLRPDLPLWAFQGALFLGLKQAEAAAASFRRACALNAADLNAALGLGEALGEIGDLAGAREAFAAALALDPSLPTFLRGALTLPPIPGSREEIAAERARFAHAVAEAETRPGRLEAADLTFPTSWFYLAYHGQDDRPIMEALNRLFAAKAPAADVRAPQLAAWRPPAGRRLKIGFVSQFLAAHTVGRVYQGIIATLDRDRFEVVVAHLPQAQRNAARAAIDAAADGVIDLSAGLLRQQQVLAEAGFDVLFYPDVGMASGSYWLARARLAPVQAVGWGHPDTTGLTSLDYFVSFGRAEPPGAEAAYTERLVRLNRLPCYYPRPAPPPPPPSRAALGLPASGRLYGCLQSLFKLHPDMDAVLAGIVARDPDGWLILPRPPHPAWEERLRRRWAAHVPQVNARARFLPWRPIQDYLTLVAEMDVHLDPPHFGSGNTLYDAMITGAPVITWPGAFARGRMVAAAYAQMGVGGDLVAERLEDYAARAVAVATDEAGRAVRRAALAAAAERDLFADRRAVAEFAAFLEASVAAAGRDERLPAGWSPPAPAAP